MSLRLYGTISGWGRSAGAVIPALGSGRYSPGPNIVLPSWLQGSDPHCTLNVFWGQPGALATVSRNPSSGIPSAPAQLARALSSTAHPTLTMTARLIVTISLAIPDSCDSSASHTVLA